MLFPIFIVCNVTEAIEFYTKVLDFTLALATPDDDPFYAILKRGDDELHLNLTPGQGRYGHCSAIVLCDAVDAAFENFVRRGLTVPTRANSPVHDGPLDQSWGTREFYVDDPSGNTIVYQQR